MKKNYFSWVILFLVILEATGSQLKEKVTHTYHMPQISSQGKYMRTLLNVNNFTSWFYATGTSANDPNGDVGGIFPRGTAGVIFTDGIVWGGFVDDTLQTLRVGGVTYREGIQQGRILPSGEAQDPNHPEARIYRIHRNYQRLSDEELRRDAAEQLLKDETEVEQTEINAIRRQYEIDWQEWPAHLGAPF